MPRWGGSKMQFCDFANKVKRYLKTEQVSRGFSAIAELLDIAKLVHVTCYDVFYLMLSEKLSHASDWL